MVGLLVPTKIIVAEYMRRVAKQRWKYRLGGVVH